MFVLNCQIKQDEQLKFPRNEPNKKKWRKKYPRSVPTDDAVDAENLTNGKEKSDDLSKEFDYYKPVACSKCNLEVGVYEDKDEIYHFFNVIASH